MRQYIIKRIFISLLTLFILITICFFLLRTLPGNPFQTETVLDAQTVERLTRYYGLDRPLIEQYLSFMGNLLRGDLGYSFRFPGRTVNSIIQRNFPVSASLGLRALAISYPVGIFLGCLAAKKRGKALDFACVFAAIIGISIPSFVLAAMLQWVFGVRLGILPVAGWRTFSHTIMPVFAVALAGIAGTTRSMRANVLEVISQDYSTTAKAKGLSEPAILLKHQLRNAIAPVITGLGVQIASVFLGSMVIEQIFVIPGLGLYYTQAIRALDYTMVMGITIFYGAILITMNFFIDLLYVLIDPRITIQ
ncbi:MAG: ABC transporter permease [Treponema sp.]|nr:ABC transporter permease [Treponema sp.]